VSGGLLTDLYELNMASSYLRRGMRATATFSLFVRRLPPVRGFLVAAGIDRCLTWLEQVGFDERDIDHLARLGYDDATLAAFAALRFTGDVWAVPEGRIVFAGEPLLEVSAPIAEAQLVETFLLNQATFHTTLASKAARCRLAAAGRIELVEFGFRRTQGVEAAMAAARGAAMVGFAATSNVEAARRFGLQASGTMAHSYIEAFPTELDAFRAYAADLPGPVTFLVDTYDTLAGTAHAIEVIGELGLTERAALRLDSGDLASLARTVRQMLDGAGMPGVRIFVSGGLDEYAIAQLVADGAPVDAAGIGTRLGVSADAPYLDSAYKLVAYDGRPVMKLSAGKATLPGAKQVFRGPGLSDTVGLRDEPPPPGTHPLLVHMLAGGRRRVGAGASPGAVLAEAAARFDADLAELPGPARALRDPVSPTPRISDALETLAETVRAQVQDQARTHAHGQ